MLTNPLIRRIETKRPNQISFEPFHHIGLDESFSMLRWNRYHNKPQNIPIENVWGNSNNNSKKQQSVCLRFNTVYRLFTFENVWTGQQEKYQPNEAATTPNSSRWLFILVSRLRLIVELFHLHLVFLSKCLRRSEMRDFSAGINE